MTIGLIREDTLAKSGEKHDSTQRVESSPPASESKSMNGYAKLNPRHRTTSHKVGSTPIALT